MDSQRPFVPQWTHPPRQRLEGWYGMQEQERHTKYVYTCNRLGWSLVAFVMGIHGGLGKEARGLMATFLKALLGQKRQKATLPLPLRLNCPPLQRGLPATPLSRNPASPCLPGRRRPG